MEPSRPRPQNNHSFAKTSHSPLPVTLASKQLSVQDNILKARPQLGPCLGTTKVQTGNRRSYGKDGLPGSGMAVETVETPPLFQEGWETLYITQVGASLQQNELGATTSGDTLDRLAKDT